MEKKKKKKKKKERKLDTKTHEEHSKSDDWHFFKEKLRTQ